MLDEKREQLTRSIDLLRKYGSDFAIKEYEYQRTKAKKAIELLGEGMPSTMIAQILKGQDEVAEAMLKRDLAKNAYTSQLEFINATKLDMRIDMVQYEKEWGNEE